MCVRPWSPIPQHRKRSKTAIVIPHPSKTSIAARPPLAPIEWAISSGYVDYEQALQVMSRRAIAIREGKARELVWLLEHPPLYTAGTSAKEQDLLSPNGLPVFRTARGGQFTYHGPGQRVA